MPVILLYGIAAAGIDETIQLFIPQRAGAITDVMIDALTGLSIPAKQHILIHGDALSYSIAAASIVAKVERDRFMRKQDAIYPMYGFSQNKGYGTKQHMDAIKAYGPCPLHRRSFLKNLL